jgi:O-antigen ligase
MTDASTTPLAPLLDAPKPDLAAALTRWWTPAVAAVAVPVLLASNLPPSPTFFNQAAAIIGWGVFACAVGWQLRGPVRWRGGLLSLIAAMGLVGLAAAGASLFDGLPAPLMWSAVGVMAAVVGVAVCGATARANGGEAVFAAFCAALMLAGALSVVIAVLQVFAPDVIDGNWIAAASGDGRAAGNVRQPNHLSSLLLWSVIATVAFVHGITRERLGAWCLLVALVFAMVLTGSRTGVIGVLLLGAWGLADGRLPKSLRAMLVAVPVIYLACWVLMTGVSHIGLGAVGGETHLTDTAASPNSRLNIWSNTVSLIARHPWLGVGFGEFNFAWSLTPFPQRPTAFFDHTHNLPLQFAVELGLPLATLVLALLGHALWQAFAAGRHATGEAAVMHRAAFMMVLMMVVHSFTEYPLWYAYFLLPTTFAFGFCLGVPQAAGPATARAPGEARDADVAVPRAPARSTAWGPKVLVAGALLMVIGGVASVADYLRVVSIFRVEDNGPSLAERIAAGERSVFFGHQAHYAAATTAERPSDAMPSFKVATHYLLDTRLMIAWAMALDEVGDTERARHIAQRLREFRNDDAKAFFAPCDAAPQGAERPFQCTAPTKQFDYRDFR